MNMRRLLLHVGHNACFSCSKLPVSIMQAIFGLHQSGLLSAVEANKTNLRTLQLLQNKTINFLLSS